MQKIEMYSFYDKKSDRYDTPFFVYDEIGAKRHFRMAARRENTLMSTFTSDYELYKIGDFSIDDGKMNILDRPVCILEGKAIVKEGEK